MTSDRLDEIWSDTLRSTSPTRDQFVRLADGIVELYGSGDASFTQHIKNRFDRVTESTGQHLAADNFDLATARAFIADEIGFSSWDQLINAVDHPGEMPLLFKYAIAAMWRGDFSALESRVGGPDAFDRQIKEWFEAGYFESEPETLAEVFSASCMLGHDKTAAYLLDNGVDPLAGMRTGLNGFHYAASSGRLDVVKLLVERKVATEVTNMYGGTVFGQALWSAVHEHTPYHAEIIKVLVEGGVHVWPETLEWWEEQPVPSAETKRSVAETLRRAASN